VILLGLDAEQAVSACERMRLAVETADWSTVHPELRVTVSIGIGQFDEAGEGDSSLLALVDGRLYEAKRRGRNCVVGPMSTLAWTRP
jgi:diguanylate cyclase (GGDEF)-like protein